MQKYDLAKTGDAIKFQTHVGMKDGYNYQKGKLYDGHVIKHSIGYSTDVEFTGDDGTIVAVTIEYGSFNGGYNSFELIISDDEFERRKVEWLENAIATAKANSAEALEKQIKYLTSVEFK